MDNSYTIPLALTIIAGIFLLLGAVFGLINILDIVLRRGWKSMMWIMIPVYPINSCYMGPLTLYLYFTYGRAKKPNGRRKRLISARDKNRAGTSLEKGEAIHEHSNGLSGPTLEHMIHHMEQDDHKQHDHQQHDHQQHDRQQHNHQQHGHQQHNHQQHGHQQHGHQQHDHQQHDHQQHDHQQHEHQQHEHQKHEHQKHEHQKHEHQQHDHQQHDHQQHDHAMHSMNHMGGHMHMIDPNRPTWATVLIGVSHCGAGCVLGDLVGEWLVYGTGVSINGQPLWPALLIDYAFALLFGIIFQYCSIAPMSGQYGLKTLVRAAKADILSLTAFELGLFGWMVAYQVGIWKYQLQTNSFLYWWQMQVGMFFGFWTSVPINVYLLAKGIKEPCA